MDLERLKDELQSLVIRSVIETVLKELHETIVVIPEAWKFLPQGRGNPCKEAAEQFIRQGATNHNFLWIDSQDVAGVDKTPLKSVSTWILGLQSELNEVRHTLAQMPVSKKLRPSEDEIMCLPIGHFYLCTQEGSKKVYVQPAWLDGFNANLVATGQLNVKDIVKPLSATLPAVPKIQPTIETDEKLRTLENLGKQITTVRKDFSDKLDEVMRYVRQLADAVGTLSTSQNVAGQVQQIDTEAIVLAVIQKLPNAEITEQKIIDAVLARVGTRIASGAAVSPAEPLKALQSKFLEEAKQRIVATIQGLTDNEKKVLQFIESLQRGVTQKDLCDKCLGIKGDSGGNQATARELSKKLHSLGLARRDDRVATTYPSLREKIKAELGFHQATDQDIDQLYAHIIAEML